MSLRELLDIVQPIGAKLVEVGHQLEIAASKDDAEITLDALAAHFDQLRDALETYRILAEVKDGWEPGEPDRPEYPN